MGWRRRERARQGWRRTENVRTEIELLGAIFSSATRLEAGERVKLREAAEHNVELFSVRHCRGKTLTSLGCSFQCLFTNAYKTMQIKLDSNEKYFSHEPGRCRYYQCLKRGGVVVCTDHQIGKHHLWHDCEIITNQSIYN